MLIARLFTEFLIFSMAGWLYECLYCTVRDGHWQNRGFLFGPICPIYGVGVMSVRLLSILPVSASGAGIPIWQIFLIFMIGSAALEYFTSWGMEKLFHSRWWDYSNMPLNLNGRICLPASLFFGTGGTLAWVYVLPLFPSLSSMASSLPLEILALLLAGLFGADLAISLEATLNLVAKLEQKEEEFNKAAENGVLRIRSIPGKVHDAGSKVRDMTHSFGPNRIHRIENPSEQLKAFALKLTEPERSMLSRIKSYHHIGPRGRKEADEDEQSGRI